MTTCYHLLAGALPDALRESAQLFWCLESTSWLSLPRDGIWLSLPGDGTWLNGVPAGLTQRHAEAWSRWLRPPQEPAEFIADLTDVITRIGADQ